MSTVGINTQDPRYVGKQDGSPGMKSAGLPALVPETVRHVYRAATAAPEAPDLALRFTPKTNGVTVDIAVGAGPVAVAAVGTAIHVTALQVGVTTYANLLAAWNADAAVLALASLTGDAGTFPAAYLGLATTALAVVHVAEGIGLIGLCADGQWRPIKYTEGGMQVSVPHLPQTPGAVPTIQQGVPGLLPVDWTETFDAVGPVVGVWHPLVGNVSITTQIGAGPVVAAAVNRDVTISGIVVGVTTLANIRAAIAAVPAVAALLTLTGDGVVAAAYAGHAAHDLEATGTIPASVLAALWPDGYYRPAEMTALGRLRTSTTLDEQIAGEDLDNDVMKVEHQYAPFLAEQNASATLKPGAGFCHGLWINCTAAGTVLIRDAIIDGGGTLLATVVFGAAGYLGPGDLPNDFTFTTGLRITLVGGAFTYNGIGR